MERATDNQGGGWDNSPVLDYAALKERMLEDDWIARELIRVYWAKLPGQLEELRELSDQGNHGDLLRLVHTLKGSSGSVCAMRLFILFGSMEIALRRNEPIQSLLVVVEDKVREFGAALGQL